MRLQKLIKSFASDVDRLVAREGINAGRDQRKSNRTAAEFGGKTQGLGITGSQDRDLAVLTSDPLGADSVDDVFRGQLKSRRVCAVARMDLTDLGTFCEERICTGRRINGLVRSAPENGHRVRRVDYGVCFDFGYVCANYFEWHRHLHCYFTIILRGGVILGCLGTAGRHTKSRAFVNDLSVLMAIGTMAATIYLFCVFCLFCAF